MLDYSSMKTKQVLQNAHLKVTHARQVLLDYFISEKRPVAADEIIGYLEKKQCDTDKATVYRIIEAFYDKGIVNKVEFGEGKFRYEIAGAEHHHLVCERCGKIEDFSDCNIEELEKDIAKKKKFLVKRHSLEFYGVCTQCQH